MKTIVSAEKASGSRALTAAAQGLAVATILAALVFAASWVLFPSLLSGSRGDFYVMSLPAAVAFILLGGGTLAVLRAPGSRGSRLAASAAALLALVLSLVATWDLMGAATPVSAWLPASSGEINGFPLNMVSPVTAVTMVAAATALLFIAVGSSFARRAALVLTTLAGLSGMMVFLAFLYTTPLVHNGKMIPMSLVSSLAFMMVAGAMAVAAGPDYWPVDLVEPTLKSRLMRVFLPLTMLLIFLEGCVVEYAHHHLLNVNPAFLSAGLGLAFLVFTGLLVIRMARRVGESVDRADVARRRTAAELQRRTGQLALSQRVARVGSWDWNIDEGSITWSEEFLKLLGVEPGSMAATYDAFLAAVHPDDRE